MKILTNNILSIKGTNALSQAGFEVIETKVAQSQLENYVLDNSINGIIIDDRLEIRQELIENCPSLKLIANIGIEMTNIDVDYAIDNGLYLINSQKAGARSSAELVFGHLFGMARFLHSSNRDMPLEGDTRFNDLHKTFSNGIELKNKTLGLIGFDLVAKEVAKIALGIGMKVVVSNAELDELYVTLDFSNGQNITLALETIEFEELIQNVDFISIHLSDQEDYLLTKNEFDKMKLEIGVINITNGNLISEVDLIEAINSNQIKFAGLDVFASEPSPSVQVLMNNKLSLSPNIARNTIEAKERASIEIANKIIKTLR